MPGPAASPPGPGRPRRRRRLSRNRRRLRLGVLGLALAVVAVALVLLLSGGGGIRRPPAPQVAVQADSSDPFAHATSRARDFTARATAGNAHVLYTKSPDGVLATARRVAGFRSAIERAVRGTVIDPDLLEGLVFVESAGRPQAIAGSDPADASGLTQILAATGSSLLGMHIDLRVSRALTRQIDAVEAGTRTGNLFALERRRAAVDPRFSPAAALAATVRYLTIAESDLHRSDLACESYHMGIGNLQDVLRDYDGGRPVPYVQLYFDVGPGRHVAAYRRLRGFGDDSQLYWWRILGAEQIMHLYRTDRTALRRATTLQLADDAGAAVLHAPGDPVRFADPRALADAYQDRSVLPLPANASALGLAYATSMGAGAAAVSAPRALYRGLRPVARSLLIELAGRIRTLSGGAAPLTVAATVADERYLQRAGLLPSPAATGYTFAIRRRYRSGDQAEAFQELLDRLQSLDLIAWVADGDVIEITVAADASRWRG